ncbi:hypothetical protein P3T76_006234 [Phytophthora citrophthora]|uniref:Uncharacterized protein n=1 Tax=Phytophthora citrophthora TaxID=4793 RepID=A0AAD9GQD1_9STRA|nr:hypothetical protein P3T76_006234 [Phytophthora citrophthora]
MSCPDAWRRADFSGNYVNIRCQVDAKDERVECDIVYLPYVLGYATSGSDIQFVVMEESGGACRPTPILKCDIFSEKTLALKVFYNLAFLLDQMERLAHRSASFGIVPFYPDENEKRKIEMLDNMIERTITRDLRISKEDLDRLAKIYKSLETLSEDKGSLEMHLQTVENFNVTTTSLTVRLSPLGDMRKPSEDEI